jgi:hypothetical protein
MFSSSDIIKMNKLSVMKWVVHITSMGQIINACKILIGISEEKRCLIKFGYRWEDNILVKWMLKK